MARRTTSVIIETTGGAPVFHIPFPLSSMAHISDTGDVQLIFRNSGGTPTFHVGGAEVGVAPKDAWDYGSVVHAVMEERKRRVAAPGGVGAGAGDVNVKVEENTPRMPGKTSAKGKEREREREPEVETANQEETNDENSAPQRTETDGLEVDEPESPQRDRGSDHSFLLRSSPNPNPMSSISNPSAKSSLPTRPLTQEERAALHRGSLTRYTFGDIYEDGRQDFAFTCEPKLPANRALTEAEESEWAPLWEALLKLDRVFNGPLRDITGLKRRSDEMMTEAAQRAHLRVRVEAVQASIPPQARAPTPNPAPPPQSLRTSSRLPNPSPLAPMAASGSGKREGNASTAAPKAAPALVPLVPIAESAHGPVSKRVPAAATTKGEGKAKESGSAPAGEKSWPPVRKRVSVKESADAGGSAPASKRTQRDAGLSASGSGSTAKRARLDMPPPDYKTHLAHTAQGVPYRAWIPLSASIAPASTKTKTTKTKTILTNAERTWLAAQVDLTRKPDWWRPVRWIELGARMWVEAAVREREAERLRERGEEQEEEEEEEEGKGAKAMRPLHHSVLLAAWDAGEWRFGGVGHEGVGRAGVPWEEWVVGEEGRKWRGVQGGMETD
ncbi:hypothetical protein C8R46DRAFT_1357168 [Mycena filopes]|nr:hypothetical protein C8R46DRAFT_1357168 [Mycena filopes]